MKQIALALLILAACARLTCQSVPAGFRQPDGDWWQNASYRERGAFVFGSVTCSAFALRRKDPDASYEAIQQAITQFYDGGAPLAAPVETAIERIYAAWQGSGKYRFEHFDTSNAPEGWLGWRSPSAIRQATVVNGFRSCQAANGRDISSAPAAKLVAWINRWYGVNPKDPSDLSLPHGDTPLAIVIPMAERAIPQ
ncbi:MAG: hypothetical protein ACRD1C_06490 [Terriglobales bacterium]